MSAKHVLEAGGNIFAGLFFVNKGEAVCLQVPFKRQSGPGQFGHAGMDRSRLHYDHEDLA